MVYVSLYRKYRSQTFNEVIGQDHVIRSLVNALNEGRLHHAYLFTGPRGTGKTSTARILAKAVNCEQGPTATPCLSCDACVSIADGSSLDVIELDMASHGGVDDARELRERAAFAPARSRMKVYILDEVHMASPAAFNALLKLIEEPPAHVLFAMATTDPHKVLPTILSRVQRLDLRRIPAQLLGEHVRAVCEAEGYAIDADALDAVVRAGDGSARDTLSVLEQVLAFTGTTVTAEAVSQVLGTSPVDRTIEAVSYVADRDLAGVLRLVQQLTEDGQDLRRFTLDLVRHVRDLLAIQVAPDHPELVDATDEHRRKVAEQSGLLPREALLRALDVLGEVLVEQRRVSPRLPLELALARLAVPGADGDIAELADRVARLEKGGSAGSPSTAEPFRGDPALTSPPVEPADDRVGDDGRELTPAGTASVAAPAREPDDDPSEEPGVAAGLDAVTAAWSEVLELVRETSKRVHAVFEPATPARLRNGILTLRYGRRYSSFHALKAKEGQYADALVGALERRLGLRVRVDTELEGDPTPIPHPPVIEPDGIVSDEVDEPDDDEQAAVDEVEVGVTADPVRVREEAEELLRSELGATRVD